MIQCSGQFNEQIPAGPKQFTARACETAIININAEKAAMRNSGGSGLWTKMI